MFFETFHSFDDAEFTVNPLGKNLFSPLHLHRSFECYIQVSGSNEVTVGGKKYQMTEGQAVFIFPFQPHSYTPLTEDETHSLYIFSPSLVPSYYNTVKNKFPTDNLFSCRLLEENAPKNRFEEKALAYLLCGEFDEGREYADKPAKLKDRFFEKLLLFVNNNFTNACSLKDACEHIGYDYAYISKKFKNLMGMSFKKYVNFLRISEAKQLLVNTEQTVGEIAEKCGFSNLRSFDREFFCQTNMTPTEYRKSK